MPQGIPYVDTATGELKYQGTSGSPAILAEVDGSVHLIPYVASYTGSTGAESVGVSTFTSIGTIVFDPSDLFDGNDKITRTLAFQAIVEVTPSVTMEIQLYNVNAGSIVTNSVSSSSSITPEVITKNLILGSSPNIPNLEQIYDVQIRISSPVSPGPSDRAICKLAQINVIWS